MMETHLSRSGAMNPAGAHSASFEAWQALVAPGDVFRHPREVLAHPGLSRAEKRTILASWASDACALADAPGLRCLVGNRAEPVPVDAVLAALGELDRDVGRTGPQVRVAKAAPRRLRRLTNLHTYVRPRRRDDDDDPPPCPAAAMPRPNTPRPNAPPSAALAAVPA